LVANKQGLNKSTEAKIAGTCGTLLDSKGKISIPRPYIHILTQWLAEGNQKRVIYQLLLIDRWTWWFGSSKIKTLQIAMDSW